MKKIMSALFLSCLIFSTYCKADAKDDSFQKFAKKMDTEEFSLKTFVDSRDELTFQIYFAGIVTGVTELGISLNRAGVKNSASICFDEKHIPKIKQVFDAVMEEWAKIQLVKKHSTSTEEFKRSESMEVTSLSIVVESTMSDM